MKGTLRSENDKYFRKNENDKYFRTGASITGVFGCLPTLLRHRFGVPRESYTVFGFSLR
jgi:hypothetical protein